jgi:hypothetical protein
MLLTWPTDQYPNIETTQAVLSWHGQQPVNLYLGLTNNLRKILF